MPRERVSGVELYYEESGTGSPVVLVHGFGLTARMWDLQVAALAPRYRVIVYDTRGQGRSEVLDDPERYSQPAMVEDLCGLLDHLGLDRAHIAGLSMGGGVALAFALAHPERVAGLAVCDAGAGSDDPADHAARLQRWHHRLQEGRIEAFADEALRDPLFADYAAGGPEAVRLLRQLFSANSARGLTHTLTGVLARRPALYTLRDRLAELSHPVLVVVGERDRPCLKVAEFLADTIPRAELVVIPGSGHLPNLEQPALFNAAFKGFLDRIED
jgi:pimeloyl-ACP methyl ester carboxylesterase